MIHTRLLIAASLIAIVAIVGCYKLDFSEPGSHQDGGSDKPLAGPDTGEAIDAASLIRGFSASVPAVISDHSAILTPSFASGTGEIAPDIGPVTSGVPVSTGPLHKTTTFTLTVTSETGVKSVATLTVEVAATPWVIASGPTSVSAMAKDGEWLYFIGTKSNLTTSAFPAILALDLADKSLHLLSADPPAKAMTTDGINLYWTSSDYLSGGSVSKILRPIGQPISLTSGGFQPTERAVATDGDFVYWASVAFGWMAGTATTKGIGSIMKVSVAGGEPTVLAANRDPITALCLAGPTISWIEYTTENKGTLYSMPKTDSGAPSPLSSGLPKLDSLACTNNGFFWYGPDGSLMAFRSPGPATSLAPGRGNGGSEGMVLDDTAIYWFTDSYLMRTLLDGGKTTTQAVLQRPAVAHTLIMDAANLYWVDKGSASIDSTIVKTPK